MKYIKLFEELEWKIEVEEITNILQDFMDDSGDLEIIDRSNFIEIRYYYDSLKDHITIKNIKNHFLEPFGRAPYRMIFYEIVLKLNEFGYETIIEYVDGYSSNRIKSFSSCKIMKN